MSQGYNNNIKRPNLQDTQLGILKTYKFCQKIQQRVLGPGESTAGVMKYLSLKIHPKLSDSMKGAVGAQLRLTWLRLVSRLHSYTSVHDVYCRTQQKWWAHLELSHRKPDILVRVLNRIALSNSSVRKCTFMQVMIQPKHERTSTTEEQK